MSTYEHKGLHGGYLAIETNEDGDAYLRSHQYGMTVKAEDAVTVAAELLKAAGVPGVFIEGELPEVSEDGNYVDAGTVSLVDVSHRTAQQYRERALAYLAISRHFEAEEASKKAEQDAAAQKLADRQDALANEMAPRDFDNGPNWYMNVSAGLRNAIDKIIALEDELAAAKPAPESGAQA